MPSNKRFHKTRQNSHLIGQKGDGDAPLGQPRTGRTRKPSGISWLLQNELRLGGILLAAPSGCLVTTLPCLLDIAQFVLDFLNCRLVSSVLPDVVTITVLATCRDVSKQSRGHSPDLDGRIPVCRADLDNDVQGRRFLSRFRADKIVGEEGPNTEGGLEPSLFRDDLVFQATVNV